jgi:hypothetical protein
VRAGPDAVLGGQPPAERHVLREVPDPGEERRVLPRLAAEHEGGPAGRPRQPGEQAEQRGLPDTVGILSLHYWRKDSR